MINNKFAFLGFGSVVAVGVAAAYMGYLPGKPALDKPVAPVSGTAQTESAPQPKAPDARPSPAPDTNAPAPQAAQPTAPAAAPQGEVAEVKPVAPTFDILRVEPSGSIVIAGKAGKNATVDLLARSNVIGTTKSSESGDFVIVLDDPLKPGDYQLVLRSTLPDGTALTSLETAIVSIPESKTGQVLALVEQSGQPSRMITKPQAVETPPAETVTAAAPKGDKPAAAVEEKALIAVEAVEIEGNKLFIAGTAEAGSTVKVYANDDLVGVTKTSPNGRFLIQTTRELAVGDYIVRADMIGKDGTTVAARAAVPFKREAGDRVSAVASVAPAPAVDGSQTPTGAVPQPDAQVAQAGDVEAPLKNVEGSVIIRRGDNLWRISRRTYGEGMRYTTIYLANKEQIRNPDMIFPGQVFALPEQDKPVQ
ncbi:LysM peptidoglycan-binding domain-containing protein [Phyllobacterium lublinensis]|uniref:LysM peptidoglycan-binding domain-containing protein n=1 Tax=Phyllobacterium lublinensis TaxID=2875708 RepID=UPI001CC93738|nr:LysM peptidoglycan-binding domain-containing protein [Phyllobacterium sp. 2063]MBZ9655114.1 LysM peptidoglycan-binding domain-containing protein [Phyllobacterium sp. 2063]